VDNEDITSLFLSLGRLPIIEALWGDSKTLAYFLDKRRTSLAYLLEKFLKMYSLYSSQSKLIVSEEAKFSLILGK